MTTANEMDSYSTPKSTASLKCHSILARSNSESDSVESKRYSPTSRLSNRPSSRLSNFLSENSTSFGTSFNNLYHEDDSDDAESVGHSDGFEADIPEEPSFHESEYACLEKVFS